MIGEQFKMMADIVHVPIGTAPALTDLLLDRCR
jgi:hypothetical protein